MRNPVVKSILAALALLSMSPAVIAQEQAPRRAVPPGFVSAGVPEMPNPPGPAPKRDLTGAWVGPQKLVMGPYPDMTPAGQAAFKHNQPESPAQPWSGNDPFQVCDPLGFPRDLLNHAVSFRGGVLITPAPNRVVMLFEQQRTYREIWMDGRTLPQKVDAKGFPDSRYYGYSVGHWEGDNVFVIDTTGLDPRVWLDETGHPHSTDAKLQERWVRPDQYHLTVTVTVDDPKYYTKPFQLVSGNYYWMKDQEFEETLCIPSEAIEYRDKVIKLSDSSSTSAH